MSSELLPVWGATGTAVAPDSTKLSVGWTLGEKPPYEYMNWWQGIVTARVNAILQNGPAPWAAGTLYQIGALVSRNGLIFRALAVNANSAPPSANWLQISQNATALTSGTVDKARLPAIMNGTTFQPVSGSIGVTVERPAAAINAIAEFKTTAGSVYLGQGTPGIFSVGATADQNTAGNRRFQVDTATGNVTWSGTATGNGAGLTALNAAALATGTLPNARLVGDYSFANLDLSGNLTLDGGNVSGANRVIVQPGGGGGTPSYGFVGVAGAGIHMFGGATSVDVMFTGAARLRVNETEIIAANGAAFTGPGTGLTRVPSSALTGTLPNARLVGDYSFANLSLTGGLSAATVAATQRFAVSAGSAADVGYGFTGYPNLGLFRVGEQLRVGVMGEVVASFTADAIVAMAGKVFRGSGADLTNLNASALTTGTVPDARVPPSLAAREFSGFPALTVTRPTGTVNAAMEFKTPANSVYAGQGSHLTFAVGPDANLAASSVFRVGVITGNVSWSGAASGDGSGITNLDAASLSTGILPNARLSGAYSFGSLSLSGDLSAGYIYAPRVESAAGSVANPGHGFVGVTGIGMYRNGTTLYLAQNDTNAIVITATGITAGANRVWGGSGANLTNLNADALTTGVLNAARLPDTTAARNWVGARYAEVDALGIGSVIMATCTGTPNWNDLVAGSRLGHSPRSPSSGSIGATGQWRILGMADSGAQGVDVYHAKRVN